MFVRAVVSFYYSSLIILKIISNFPIIHKHLLFPWIIQKQRSAVTCLPQHPSSNLTPSSLLFYGLSCLQVYSLAPCSCWPWLEASKGGGWVWIIVGSGGRYPTAQPGPEQLLRRCLLNTDGQECLFGVLFREGISPDWCLISAGSPLLSCHPHCSSQTKILKM